MSAENVPPCGYHTLTPRMVVRDVATQVEFLRAAFGASGDVAADRPAEIHIGDSLVMITAAGARELSRCSRAATSRTRIAPNRRAVSAGATVVEEPAGHLRR